MGGGKSSGSSSTTTTSEPWSAQKPYLKDIYQQAQGLYNSGGMAPNYYSGDTVAERDPYTQQAIDLQAQRALEGSATVDSANSYVQNLLSGDMLTNNPFSSATNPYLDDMVSRAVSQTMTGVSSQFSGAGRYGSGAQAAASADAAGNVATDMYGQAYSSDMDRYASVYNNILNNMTSGAGLATSLANQDYVDLAALAESGSANEDYAQQLINADVDKYNYQSTQGLTALQNYMNLIQGNYGGTSTTTGSTGSGSTFGNVAGSALSGAGLGSLLGIGSGYGALTGGLLGLFG